MVTFFLTIKILNVLSYRLGALPFASFLITQGTNTTWQDLLPPRGEFHKGVNDITKKSKWNNFVFKFASFDGGKRFCAYKAVPDSLNFTTLLFKMTS